nr:CAP domain-containing protein [uncultured Sphingomonas sp.]
MTVSTGAAAQRMPSPNWPAPADRGDALLVKTALRIHNAARAKFGVPPISWNDSLAQGAMAHAQYMAATGIYGHDKTPGRRKVAGENLWRGTRGTFSYDIMMDLMVEEERFFRPGAFPNNSTTPDWEAVAHYTQIIWPTTTEVGCALASSATTDYFVCRYAPTGNKDGTYLVAGGRQPDPLASAPAGTGTQIASSRR